MYTNDWVSDRSAKLAFSCLSSLYSAILGVDTTDYFVLTRDDLNARIRLAIEAAHVESPDG